jgi:hypothetical protein
MRSSGPVEPERPREGFRERVRRQLRADIDRVAEERRRRKESPHESVIYAGQTKDIEERSPKPYKAERNRFYARVHRMPAAKREAILLIILEGQCAKIREGSQRPRHAPTDSSAGTFLGADGKFRKKRWSVDRWAQNMAPHLFARLRPDNSSDRATYGAMEEVFRIFFDLDKPLSAEAVKRLVIRAQQS